MQISSGGGTEAAWASAGDELFYRTMNDSEPRLVAARLRFAPEPEVVSRRPLFSLADVVATNPHANYDVSPEGRSFVVVRRSAATRIVVIQHLPALVRRLQGG